MNQLELQLAHARASQIVGDVLAATEGNPNQALIALLVAEELALVATQATAVTDGKERALKRLVSFTADVHARVLRWLATAGEVLNAPVGRSG